MFVLFFLLVSRYTFIPITYVRPYDILLSIGEGEPIQWRDNEKIQLYGCTLLCALILIGSDEQYKFARRKLAKLQIAAKSVSGVRRSEE